MSDALVVAIAGFIGILGSICSWMFSTDYPALDISIGSVLLACLIISVSLDYFDFFVGSHESKSDK